MWTPKNGKHADTFPPWTQLQGTSLWLHSVQDTDLGGENIVWKEKKLNQEMSWSIFFLVQKKEFVV